ncbi:MAG: glycosyltransferase family 9 protein [Verrucomicrobiae bacterium]|nr:glycosyltransferase family 9 protein [Verrucomicrobiae bacterium]
MKSALFIRGGALGDFILTLPSIRVFRAAFPDARVEIVGYPRIAALVENRGYASAVQPLDQRGMATFFAEDADLDPALCAYLASFDLVVSFLYDPDGVFRRNLERAGVRRAITADSRPGPTLHASEHLAAWLEDAGLPRAIETPRLFPSAADAAEAAARHPPPTGPRVALHLGSGSPSKNWPVRRFVELAERFEAKGIETIVLDGPADDAAQKQFWATPLPPGIRRCTGLPLTVLAAFLARCTTFVGHDSGITHLAAAVGAPVCAIFGPTDARVWRPRGAKAVVLQRGRDPANVTVEDVARAAEQGLAAAPAS